MEGENLEDVLVDDVEGWGVCKLHPYISQAQAGCRLTIRSAAWSKG